MEYGSRCIALPVLPLYVHVLSKQHTKQERGQIMFGVNPDFFVGSIKKISVKKLNRRGGSYVSSNDRCVDSFQL